VSGTQHAGPGGAPGSGAGRSCVWGMDLGAAPGKDGACVGGHARGRGPTSGVRDKRAHVGAHSLARTQLSIAA